jgi:hypothetical protein
MFVCLVVIGMAAPARAQADKPFDFHIGGGWAFPVGTYSDEFNSGGEFVIGGTFWVTPMIGIQGQYEYDKNSGPSRTVSLTQNPIAGAITNGIIESNHQMHAAVFDIVVRSPHHADQMMNAYFLAGGGYYHRIIQLTSPAVGYTTICDPYWFYCYPTAVSIDQILGDRSSNDFGINFGAGVNFGHEAKFFVEARYVYVSGPSTSGLTAQPLATSTATKATASYIPLLFGLRF